MKAFQLIQALEAMPQHAEVWVLWDSSLRSCVDHVWLSNAGMVVLADDQDFEAMSTVNEEYRPWKATKR